MLIYPDRWDEYMYHDRVRTFKKDTPKEIIEEAKKLNTLVKETSGRDFFHFEENEK